MLQILFAPPPQAVLSLLPATLTAPKRWRAACVFGHFHRVVGLEPYLECLILVAASYRGHPVVYCPLAWVTTDQALCAGREIWGFPKRLAEIELAVDQSCASAHLAQAGKLLLTARLGLDQIGKLQHILFGDVVVQKDIPDCQGGPPLRQLCRVAFQDYSLSLLRGGEPLLQIADQSVFDLFRPFQIIGGTYGRGRMVLPFGQVIES